MAAESLATGRYVFGVDVFSRSQTLFMPLLSGPVPPDYQVGPGDELVLGAIRGGDLAGPILVPSGLSRRRP